MHYIHFLLGISRMQHDICFTKWTEVEVKKSCWIPGQLQGYLLGDSAYGLRSFLLTPYLHPNGQALRELQQGLGQSACRNRKGIWKFEAAFCCLHVSCCTKFATTWGGVGGIMTFCWVTCYPMLLHLLYISNQQLLVMTAEELEHHRGNTFHVITQIDRWPISQVSQRISPISHKALIGNRHAHFCYTWVHRGKFGWCTARFVRWFY